MKLTTYPMPEEMIERLDAESKRTGASKSEIVRRAVKFYLSHMEIRREMDDLIASIQQKEDMK